jgi:LEA14-like dessication related protein
MNCRKEKSFYPTPRYPLLLAIAFLLSMSACRTPQELSFVRISDWKTSEPGLSTSTVTGHLVFHNPNPYRLTLRELTAEVALEGRNLGNLIIDSAVLIPASSNFTVPARFVVNMPAFYKAGVSILLGGELLITVTGTARGSRSFITRSIPVNYAGKHRLSDFRL